MYTAKVNNKDYKIEFNSQSSDTGSVNGESFQLDIIKTGNSYHVLKDNNSYNINILSVNYSKKQVLLEVNKHQYNVKITDELDVLLKSMGINKQTTKIEKDFKAPMPGLVTEIYVKKGDEIKKGDNLLVLEAMKMENNLKAENNTIIKDIIVKQGNSVEKFPIQYLFCMPIF